MPSQEEARFDKMKAAIAVSTRWAARPETCPLSLLFSRAGIALEIVGSIDEALRRLEEPDRQEQCLILDASVATEMADARAIESVGGAIQRLQKKRPVVATLVAATSPTVPLVAAAFRAGAADVLDLGAGDELAILKALDRAAAHHQAKHARNIRVAELRQLVEEFLRVLVRLERRTLELEAALHPEPENDEDKETVERPRVLIVDDEHAVTDRLVDVLTRVDLVAVGAYSGEEAVERVEAAKKAREPVDLLLVDHMLPGIDGFETVQQIRRVYPGLTTMLMTGYSSAESAARAVDLGAVGYILKPFSDLGELAERIKTQAVRCAAERRERRYLALIKQRHAQFLERYRKVSAELDSLSD